MSTPVTKFEAKPEATPARMRIARPQEFAECKRCLSNQTKAGDVIVSIKNTGWWHDACYRVVNPRFYLGLDVAVPVEPSADAVPF